MSCSTSCRLHTLVVGAGQRAGRVAKPDRVSGVLYSPHPHKSLFEQQHHRRRSPRPTPWRNLRHLHGQSDQTCGLLPWSAGHRTDLRLARADPRMDYPGCPTGRLRRRRTGRGQSGVGVFSVLWIFLAAMLAGLAIHSLLYYPLVAWLVGKKSPKKYLGQGADAIMTASRATAA